MLIAAKNEARPISMSPIHLLFRSLPDQRPQRLFHGRSFSDTAVKWVRDRGLDHTVEREKNLMPMISVKNFIKSEPSKSLPISIITQNRESLNIPIRPIEFVRKYPTVFEEFLPGGIGVQPHVRLTAQVLDLDLDEQLMYQSESYKQQVADRLLKLLMLCRTNKIPLSILDRLKWDLGLPQDYERSIVPDFPDYFRIMGAKNSSSDSRVLEVVCWNSELSTSVMEKKAMSAVSGYTKGMPIAFPMQCLDMDKKLKKWVDEWQKLPYFTPYENAAHLPPKSDEADKWAVAVLHEFLHILVPKKTEKDNVLCLGEYLGLRSRFKRALLQHPGIFYISNKIDTHTVVLREGYKRGSLVESHPLMDMRSRYIHLMHTEKEDNKSISVPGGSKSTQKMKQQSCDSGGKGEEEEENEGKVSLSDNDEEIEDDDENEKDYRKDHRGRSRRTKLNVEGNRGRSRRTNSNVEGHIRKPERGRSAQIEDDEEDENEKDYRKGVASNRGRSRRTNSNVEGHIRKPERGRSAEIEDDEEDENETEKDNRKGVANNRGRSRITKLNVEGNRGRSRRTNSNVEGYIRKPEIGRSAVKHSDKSKEKYSPRIPRRTELLTEKRDARNSGISSRERSNNFTSRRRSKPEVASI
ncbi:hypothetical protein FNV43_RR12556 [Rhamnella rubrinervis]|uniref:PORR domain-containing protein n=1 Tax=Rhamnella rubrinervis TaxID=2594499 RepID=A0A8K0H7Y1_9ROSA|nr:hypothetical protein FNV43_RR12556 [Rhamnella rubrinervis]